MRKSFVNTQGNGFQITFPNGVTLSTQFGRWSYSENNKLKAKAEGVLSSNDAEVAIIGPDGMFITEYSENGEVVLPHVQMEEWLKIFHWCENYKKESQS